MPAESHRETLLKVALVMFGLICALSFRGWFQLYLETNGMRRDTATLLTFFVELPLLALLLWPLWNKNRYLLRDGLNWSGLTLRIVLIGLGLGLTLRLASHGFLIAKVAFGFTRSDNPAAIAGPDFSWNCPSLEWILLHTVSMAILVPLLEELIHRGWVFVWLRRYGTFAAVIGSSLIFTMMHPVSSMDYAFVFGIYLAVLYKNTGTLWAGLVAHIAANFVIVFDWYCLRTQWNPVGTNEGLTAVGWMASVTMIFGLVIAAFLVSKNIAAPRCGDVSRTR